MKNRISIETIAKKCETYSAYDKEIHEKNRMAIGIIATWNLCL
jgi:hypothetical protein